MAIYHCTCQVISRGAGRSAVGAAAYRSGDTLTSEYDGTTHDYANKGGVVYSEIMLCENAPEQYLDRSTLWNEVERVEKSAKAQLCREYEMALPRELNHDEQKEFVREFVKRSFTDKGMCADWSIHDKGDGNPHVHILVTMRPIEKDGSWGQKQKKEYILDKDGNKQYDKKKQTYKCKTVKTTDWDSKEFLQNVRENWAVAINGELERKGLLQRVDHRSFKDQGIDRVPTLHVGVAQSAMKKKIEKGQKPPIEWEYDKTEINSRIKWANEEDAALAEKEAEVKKERDAAEKQAAIVATIPHYAVYEYGKVDVQSINEEYRADIASDGGKVLVQRGEAERTVIRDVKRSDREVCRLIDTTGLDKLIAEQRAAQRQGKPAQRREEELIRQIQEGFDNLRFMEQNGIYSRKQVQETVAGLSKQLDECKAELRSAEVMLAHLGREDADKAAQYQRKVVTLHSSVSELSKMLDGYTRCMRVLDRIDRERKQERTVAMEEFVQAFGPVTRKPKQADVAARRQDPAQQEQSPAAVVIDIAAVGRQLALYRAAFVEASQQAQKPLMPEYKYNPEGRKQAEQLGVLLDKVKSAKEVLDGMAAERDSLGMFKRKQKQAINDKMEEIRKKVWPDLEALESSGFKVFPIAEAEQSVAELKEQAAREESKALEVQRHNDAVSKAIKERDTAKAAYIALANDVPEDMKQAVAAEMARNKPKDERIGMSTSEIKAERAAQKELDEALKPAAQAQERLQSQKTKAKRKVKGDWGD